MQGERLLQKRAGTQAGASPLVGRPLPALQERSSESPSVSPLFLEGARGGRAVHSPDEFRCQKVGGVKCPPCAGLEFAHQS